jgi:hypothetical protein
MADNTSSKFAIITEAKKEMDEVGSSTWYEEITASYQGVLQFTMDIAPGANTQMAGIAFDEPLMNGGQYYQSTSVIEPVKYADPCLYDNDLSTFKLSTVYGAVTYNNGVSTPMNDITVMLMSGAVEIASSMTDASGNYNLSSMDDGAYTLEQNTAGKIWGGLSMNDVFMARQKFVGIGSFTPLQEMAMDVSWDGILGMNDVFTMRQRFASVISSWAAPDFVFLPQAVTVTGGLGAATYQTLCSGDPDKSYTPPAK